MLFCQALLIVFSVQWLISQYNEERSRLKENLTDLFTDVQQRISDSLYLTNIVDTSANAAIKAAGTYNRKNDLNKEIKLSERGVHHVLSTIGANYISPTLEKHLYGIDSIVFNEMFTSSMRHNGWNFNAEWINNSDSDKFSKSSIFIRSDFFTDARGVVVKDYRGYLIGHMLPQYLFVVILLSLTAAAFMIAYKSLKAQLKLGEMKDDFISNMSHELKTPIATVKAALEALSTYNIIDNPKLNREYLSMATAEMDRLELLATRVLNTSLLESGKIYLQQESCNLELLVREVIGAMQPRFDKNNTTLTFETFGNDFNVPADKLHIQGVLVNLLDNSMKYGQGRINILIRLKEAAGKLQLSFADNGPGIPEEYRDKIFEKFFRVPNADRHDTKGHGLGLSYAAQVMRQHNGSINVRNIAQGGCEFTLTF